MKKSEVKYTAIQIAGALMNNEALLNNFILRIAVKNPDAIIRASKSFVEDVSKGNDSGYNSDIAIIAEKVLSQYVKKDLMLTFLHQTWNEYKSDRIMAIKKLREKYNLTLKEAIGFFNEWYEKNQEKS